MFNSAPFNQDVFNYAEGVPSLKQDLCISGQLVAKSTDSSFPLMLSYLDGLTMTVSLRDPAATTYFADFADGTMKNTGWTTKYKALDEVASGVYMTTVDVSALTGITGNSLSVEYVIGGTDYSGFLTSVLTIDGVCVEGTVERSTPYTGSVPQGAGRIFRTLPAVKKELQKRAKPEIEIDRETLEEAVGAVIAKLDSDDKAAQLNVALDRIRTEVEFREQLIEFHRVGQIETACLERLRQLKLTAEDEAMILIFLALELD